MLKIFPIRLFSDNYSYFIFGKNAKKCILVDPADHNVVIPFLKKWPDHIVSHLFFTHKHWDHVGDLPALLSGLKELYNADVEVVSGEYDGIKGTTKSIAGNDSFKIEEIKVNCIQTPCHTKGAVCFYLENEESASKHNESSQVKDDHVECYRAVFTGDTHFVGGCGRFFEGTPDQMLKNMDNLAALPKDTFVFPGHEYTAANLEWAMGIEWENKAYENKLKWVNDRISKGSFGIPSTIREEFDINIFWRTREAKVQERTGKTDPVEVMGALREMKDKKVNLKKKASEEDL